MRLIIQGQSIVAEDHTDTYSGPHEWHEAPEDYVVGSLDYEGFIPFASVNEAQIIHNKIEALWAAADKYTSGYIGGVAIGILTIGVLQQKPKALAVSAWSSQVWSEYYARKTLVTATSIDDLDFSVFGPIPHSVPELQSEVGL